MTCVILLRKKPTSGSHAGLGYPPLPLEVLENMLAFCPSVDWERKTLSLAYGLTEQWSPRRRSPEGQWRREVFTLGKRIFWRRIWSSTVPGRRDGWSIALHSLLDGSSWFSWIDSQSDSQRFLSSHQMCGIFFFSYSNCSGLSMSLHIHLLKP